VDLRSIDSYGIATRPSMDPDQGASTAILSFPNLGSKAQIHMPLRTYAGVLIKMKEEKVGNEK
jgi:hypothetical protein